MIWLPPAKEMLPTVSVCVVVPLLTKRKMELFSATAVLSFQRSTLPAVVPLLSKLTKLPGCMFTV